MDIIDYKTVLVSLGQRTRVVTFAVGGSSIDTLEKAIRGAFADSPVLSTKCRVIIQIKSEDWGGAFVDLQPEEDVPNRSILRAIVESDPEPLALRAALVSEHLPSDAVMKEQSKKLSPQPNTSGTPVARKKIDSEMRRTRMKELDEDMKQLDQQIMFKEKRRDQAESVRNYKLCDLLTEEIGKLKGTRRETSNELKLFQRKEQQAKWYLEKRRKSSDGSSVKKPRKSSGGFFSDSDNPLESPSSVATDATVSLSDSGSEMESGCPFNVLASASGASTDELMVDTIDTGSVSEATSLAPSPCSSGATSSKSNSKRRCCSSSADSPTLSATACDLYTSIFS